jgi:hypothetical protein
LQGQQFAEIRQLLRAEIGFENAESQSSGLVYDNDVCCAIKFLDRIRNAAT